MCASSSFEPDRHDKGGYMAKRNGAASLDATIRMFCRLSASKMHHTHVLVALEALRLQRGGKKPRLKDISDRTGLPYTSVSRLAYDLVDRFQVASYEDEKKDRRVRYLVISDAKRLEKLVALS